MWSLLPAFDDPRPLTFQLQAGRTDNNDADDWVNVGGPVTDRYYAVDGQQRLLGKTRNLYYRVVLTSSRGTYYSDPVGQLGTLDRESWRLARAAVNAETIYMRAGDGELGYLLKRRTAGPPCPHCLDPQTQEIRQPYCPECLGTGYLCGFFFPIGCVWTSIEPRGYHLNLDEKRGTIQDIVQKARISNHWLLSEEDVFVNKATDDRYYVHSIQDLYTFRGVPISAQVELRLAPSSDPVYLINIPEQLEPLSRMAVRAGGVQR